MEQDSVYRIWNRVTKEYITIGYGEETQSIWTYYPHNIIGYHFDDLHEVHKFALQFDSKLNSKGEEI